MNILIVIPAPIPVMPIAGGNVGGALGGLNKLAIAIAIAMLIWAVFEIVIGYFKVRHIKEIYGMTRLWDKISWKSNVGLPLCILGFIALCYMVYVIYLLIWN